MACVASSALSLYGDLQLLDLSRDARGASEYGRFYICLTMKRKKYVVL